MRSIYSVLPAFMLVLFMCPLSENSAQSFTRITSQSNPVVTDSLTAGYPGCSFIDYNNDGLQDLFVNNDYLYRNDGNGTFSSVPVFKGRTQPLGPGKAPASGSSWADYNNDGLLDMFSASAKSYLFRNSGNGNFETVTTGAIGDTMNNRGWACAWADYDLDGNTDLIITNPAGFVPGAPQPCHLFHNDGPPGYTFTEVKGFEFTGQLAPYTVATWSDFDLDGDPDLFIASGPATGTPAKDFLYINRLKETGTVQFERMISSLPATDLQDGQVWNWIDYDNDRDPDAFITNYRSAPNRLYRNDGGSFTPVNTSMELSGQGCLSNAWGDFDNDGFSDVIITSETRNYYYRNNGDGTFTAMDNGILAAGQGRGLTIGDYDNDGNLDVFIAGFPSVRGLYHNENSNGNRWKEIKLTGSASNKAAIGAVVHLKAVINGRPVWLMREVSAQNSFNSQNSLVVHFGLGDAAVIDTLVINWPSGTEQVLTGLQTNDIQTIVETPATGIGEDNLKGLNYRLEQNYPNPFNPSTMIGYSLPAEGEMSIKVFDPLGNEVAIIVNEWKKAGYHEAVFDGTGLSSGIYFYTMNAGKYRQTKKFILMK